MTQPINPQHSAIIPPKSGGAIALCGLIFAIIAGTKANDGKDYKYPYSLQLVK